jgi:hypothetical protein
MDSSYITVTKEYCRRGATVIRENIRKYKLESIQGIMQRRHGIWPFRYLPDIDQATSIFFSRELDKKLGDFPRSNYFFRREFAVDLEELVELSNDSIFLSLIQASVLDQEIKIFDSSQSLNS